MDRAALRVLVFEILKKNPQTHLHTIENEIRQRADAYEHREILTLQEIVWNLLIQGILAPGKDSLNLNLPFVHVTEYGARCLEDGSILAHDPTQYVAGLLEKTDNRADASTVESAREAQQSFLVGRYSATIVLLARAAEVLFEDLTTSLIRVRNRAGRGTKTLERIAHTPDAFYRTLVRFLAGHRLPERLSGQLDPHLFGLHTLIQLTRSAGGRPRHPLVSQDSALARLLLFPEQAQFVYQLIDWIENPSSE